MCPKVANEMANRVDHDQAALQEHSNLSLQCLQRPVCLNTLDHYHVGNTKIPTCAVDGAGTV